MTYDENAAAAAPEGEDTTPVGTEEVLQGNDVGAVAQEGVGVDEKNPFALFGGEALKVEPKQSDAHQGRILAISKFEAPRTGSIAIQVHLQSDNTGNSDEWTIWVPKTFIENTPEFLTGKMGIENLNPGEPDPEHPGKLKGNERQQYGMAIRNSAGDASVQKLLALAAKAGRSPAPGTQINNFDDYIQVLSDLTQDLEVIYTRRADGVTEDNPRGFLHVSGVHSTERAQDPKAFRGYKKQWEL